MEQKNKEEKLIEWLGMSAKEKKLWNGWAGFLNNVRFSEENMFLTSEKIKAERRTLKEKNRKKRESNG